MTQLISCLVQVAECRSKIGRAMRRSAFRARFSSFKVKLVRVCVGDAKSSDERGKKASIGKYDRANLFLDNREIERGYCTAPRRHVISIIQMFNCSLSIIAYRHRAHLGASQYSFRVSFSGISGLIKPQALIYEYARNYAAFVRRFMKLAAFVIARCLANFTATLLRIRTFRRCRISVEI
jgi:hypothetical protein